MSEVHRMEMEMQEPRSNPPRTRVLGKTGNFTGLEVVVGPLS